jgi:hypothetical protein
MGWYACACGAVGFKIGPAEGWTEAQDAAVSEVQACPRCEFEICNLSGYTSIH